MHAMCTEEHYCTATLQHYFLLGGRDPIMGSPCSPSLSHDGTPGIVRPEPKKYGHRRFPAWVPASYPGYWAGYGCEGHDSAFTTVRLGDLVPIKQKMKNPKTSFAIEALKGGAFGALVAVIFYYPQVSAYYIGKRNTYYAKHPTSAYPTVEGESSEPKTQR